MAIGFNPAAAGDGDSTIIGSNTPPDNSDSKGSNKPIEIYKQPELEQLNFDTSEMSLKIAGVESTTPFNNFTKVLWNALGVNVSGVGSSGIKGLSEFVIAKGVYPYDSPDATPVVYSSVMTKQNNFYIRKPAPGRVNGSIDRTWTAELMRNSTSIHKSGYNTVAWKYLPNNSIIPNCVGGVRGRFQELLFGLDKNLDKSLGINDGGKFGDMPPFTLTPGQTISGDFKLWKDESGTYGPVGGLWGKYHWTKNPPLFPGCLISYKNVYKSGNSWHSLSGDGYYGHVEFVEAVYNFGTKDEYAITLGSAMGEFDDGHVLFCRKRYRYETDGVVSSGKGIYSYGKYGDVNILYTPLCNFTIGLNLTSEGTILQPVALDFTKRADEQIEAYNKVIDLLTKRGDILKVGDKVQITYKGNKKPDGSGKPVNKIGGVGYIRKIHSSGNQYRYEVSDKLYNGELLGYFPQTSLLLE